jgi:hypothetical protein
MDISDEGETIQTIFTADLIIDTGGKNGSAIEQLVADGAPISEESETAGILVKDLGSLNGVFVNGERVKEPRRIKRGDFVQAGTTLMAVAVATQQAGTEVRAYDRAPALKGSATMMMSASDSRLASAV